MLRQELHRKQAPAHQTAPSVDGDEERQPILEYTQPTRLVVPSERSFALAVALVLPGWSAGLQLGVIISHWRQSRVPSVARIAGVARIAPVRPMDLPVVVAGEDASEVVTAVSTASPSPQGNQPIHSQSTSYTNLRPRQATQSPEGLKRS